MITCSTCSATWTALTAAHCSARGCHQTFASVNLFDLHRDQHGQRGHCIPPEQVVGKDGERRLFFRGGMWRGPEMSPERLAQLAELRAAAAEEDP